MPSEWERVEGHIATPGGFQAAAIAAGIKKASGALDLGLIFSEKPGTFAAGVFTANLVAAAPVSLSRQHLQASRGRARAIVANAGNANACTGKEGQKPLGTPPSAPRNFWASRRRKCWWHPRV